jgi:hypothetical protein
MRIPRWLLVILIAVSAGAALVASGWWWVTWPERTAREFVAFLSEGNLDAANRMLVATQDPTLDYVPANIELFASAKEWFSQGSEPRTALDVLFARGQYRIDEHEGIVLAVERNQVVVIANVLQIVSSESLGKVISYTGDSYRISKLIRD